MEKEAVIIFYEVNPEYISYLRKFDNKVSLKDSRSFLGLELTIDKKKYCVPLTSTIIPNSGKKRSELVTTNIKDSKDNIIACILYNNMIPTLENYRTKINFEEHKHSSYFNKEYQYIKKNFEKKQKEYMFLVQMEKMIF